MGKWDPKVKKETVKRIKNGEDRTKLAFELLTKNWRNFQHKPTPIQLRLRRIKRLFLDWEYIVDNFGMEKLERKQGNYSTVRKGRRKKPRDINDLTENDRRIYQEIMEDILKDKGIDNQEIMERVKKRKEELDNTKNSLEAFGISKSSFYYKSTSKKKEFILNQRLLKEIKSLFDFSEGSIGRDKAFMTLNPYFNVSSYIFRRHWELLNIKSKYHIKRKKPPVEKKYKGIWTSDKIKFKFKTNKPNEIWCSDISYIKVKNKYKMLFIIIDTFNNEIKSWKLIENRKSSTIVEQLKTAIKRHGLPKIFHSDHGVEYANYKFKKFLNKNNIVQSMSPKGNSLANRPSEFFFSCLKREFIYNTEFHDLKTQIKKYMMWYHNFRIQRCLENKTPIEYSTGARHFYVS